MRPLAALERFIEGIVERPSARLFGARLQPIQLQRRLERAMDDERLTTAGRTLVPNRYTVLLHADDLASFGDVAPSLAAELADSCLLHARRQRWIVADRPRVELAANRAVRKGEIRVSAIFAEPEVVQRAPDADPDAVDVAEAAQVAPGDGGGVPERTMVFRPPVPRGPVASLSIVRPDGTSDRVTVDGAFVRIGRATDNDLVLQDGQVSRHHARLQMRAGLLVLADLGSTNGTFVNGERITEIALGEGDQVLVGDTLLVVESGPAS